MSPSVFLTDRWDANPAGSWGDEGLRVLWSTREEENHQVSVLSQASLLFTGVITTSARGALVTAQSVSRFFHAAQQVFRKSHLAISGDTDALHDHLKLAREMTCLTSAALVGKCTWRTFQSRSYLARWAKCLTELTCRHVFLFGLAGL